MNLKKILIKQFTFFCKYGIIYAVLFCHKVGKRMQIIKFSVGNILELKKPHPCGEKLFKVMRVGSDVRIVCTGCGRDMTLDRVKLEKSIKNVIV